MSVLVLKDCFLSLDGTEKSDHVKQVTLNYSADALDKTAMGNDTRIKTGGLKDWSMDVQFFQDYAAGDIDAILFPLVGSTCALVLRPATSAAATNNPQYSGTGLLESYQPVQGTVGELAMVTARFSAASDLTRATA